VGCYASVPGLLLQLIGGTACLLLLLQIMVDFALFDVKGHLLMGRWGTTS
jgi:hypothetical protein